jgi:hypothetical protein
LSKIDEITDAPIAGICSVVNATSTVMKLSIVFIYEKRHCIGSPSEREVRVLEQVIGQRTTSCVWALPSSSIAAL